MIRLLTGEVTKQMTVLENQSCNGVERNKELKCPILWPDNNLIDLLRFLKMILLLLTCGIAHIMCIIQLHSKLINVMFVVHLTTLPCKYSSDHYKSWRSSGKSTSQWFNRLYSFHCKMRSWTSIALKSTSSTQIPLVISLPGNTSSPAKYGLSTHVLQKLPQIPLHSSLASASRFPSLLEGILTYYWQSIPKKKKKLLSPVNFFHQPFSVCFLCCI